MLLVVADTSPIFYLLSIDHIDLLQRLFGKVIVPDAVHTELCHLRPLKWSVNGWRVCLSGYR
jgi:predicted nucleic acid-binding protein